MIRRLIPLVVVVGLLTLTACNNPSPTPSADPADSLAPGSSSSSDATAMPNVAMDNDASVVDQDYTIPLQDGDLHFTLYGSWLGINDTDAANPTAVAALRTLYPSYGAEIDAMTAPDFGLGKGGTVFFAYDVSSAALAEDSLRRDVSFMVGLPIDTDDELLAAARANVASDPALQAAFQGESWRSLPMGAAVGMVFTGYGDASLSGIQWWIRGAAYTYVVTFIGTEAQAADGDLENQMERTLQSLQ